MKLKLILALCLFTSCAVAQTPGHQDAIKVPSAWMGGNIDYVKQPNGLLYLPWDYDVSGKEYPLIVFDHGVGEAGTDINKVRNQGLPKVIDDGNPPYSVMTGDTTWFIVLSMQNGSWSPSTSQNIEAIEFLEKQGLRIDQKRIYITGLSAGGSNSQNTLADRGEFSAGVSMSPASALTDARIDSFYDKYIWYFQGTSDVTVSPNNAYSNVEKINNKFPDHARLTKYPGGHCCWTTYYNPNWENGQNIYDWLLTHSLDTKPIETTIPDQTTEPEKPVQELQQPSAIITGGNKTGTGVINISTDTVTLYATESTGSIDKWSWGVLGTSPNKSATIYRQGNKAFISNLTDGTYVFYLTVSSSKIGYPSSDKITVNVNKGQAVPVIASIKVVYSDGSTATITNVQNVTVQMKDGTVKEFKQ